MILRMSSAVTTPRSIVLDPNEQRVIEEARARRLQRLAKRELWSLVAFTTAFVAAASAMALYLPSDRSPGVVGDARPDRRVRSRVPARVRDRQRAQRCRRS